MKKLTTLLSLLLVASVSFAQTLDFSSSNGFSIDSNYDTMGSIVGTNGITFNGLDNQVISGVWSLAQDLTGWGTSFTEAHVLGSMTQTQSSLYSVTLYDSNFATIVLAGGEWPKIDSTFSSVDLNIPTTAFAWNDVTAIDINTGGAGSPIAGTISSITVPEPSTYALIAGFAAFLFVAIRRRK
jgi:hypothetical protein